jgi:hypothetical protein
MPLRKRTLHISSATLCAIILPFAAHAMDPSSYSEALKIADEYVKKQRAAQIENRSQALSTSMVRALYGRYYEVGETWDVAAIHLDSSAMRRTSDPDQLRDREGRVGIFRYEVKKVTGGAHPEILVHVSQLSDFGKSPIDPKIQTVVLKVDDQLNENDKTYVRAGTPTMVLSGSSTAMRTQATPLELYPLDVPDVATADRATTSQMPELPSGLQAIASQVGWKPELGRSAWFDQSDFFGRPVQFLWQQGDPWPAFLKTPHGVAILIRKGGH